jgi:hypothetical protein
MQTSGHVNQLQHFPVFKMGKRTKSSCSFRTKFGLEDRNRGIDKPHARSRDDSGNNHMRTRVRSRLKQSSNDHDHDTNADGLFSSDILAKDGCGNTAEKTSYLIDGNNETSDGRTGLVKRCLKGRRVDKAVLNPKSVREEEKCWRKEKLARP